MSTRFARAAGVLVALMAASTASGCGLLLDAWPPDPPVDAPMDASVRDAALDRDAGTETDADVSSADTGSENFDASVSTDASSSDATTRPEASVSVDASIVVDAPMRPDAGRVDASLFECVGAHPIVGPPRTCDPGACLCTSIDACFGTDAIRLCCSDGFVCAPPPSDCAPTHPIVGETRTCESGNCYCGNPDACFPADRAERCCGVPVICIP